MKRIISIWLAALIMAVQPAQAVVMVNFGQSAMSGVVVTDDFNRANENPIAAPWGQIHTLERPKIDTNALRSVSSSAALAYYNQTIGANQYAQIKLLTALINDNGVILRADTSRTDLAQIGYVVMYNDGNIIIRKWLWDTFTNLASVSAGSLAVGDTLKGTISGSTIKAWVNGVEVLSTTDSTYSTGYVGVTVKNQYDPASDDFEGGEL